MRSQHVDEFNHDPWAANYDRHVRNEADPIRAGYAETLAWTVAQAAIEPTDVVIDLGAGTGNTSALIRAAARVLCVDVSPKMTAQAPPKLQHLAQVDYIHADLLEYFAHGPVLCDAVISTYAIHHLTEAEKATLFSMIHAALKPGGRAAFGDLMFRDAQAEADLRAAYQKAGMTELLLDFDEEFFWHVDRAAAALTDCGFAVEAVKQFSTLSWGISVRRE